MIRTRWYRTFRERTQYATHDRFPFYEIAAKYLPVDEEALVADVGAGNASFAEHLNLKDRYDNLHLLDANPDTVEHLKRRYPHVHLYQAPDRLPFEAGAVAFLHCSHLIEHLRHEALYSFLKEVDRVLAAHGVTVISTPLLWEGFYDDLSHVKPYSPKVLKNYLCTYGGNRTAQSISTEYTIQELVYRYRAQEPFRYLGSCNPLLDFLIQASRKAIRQLGIRVFERTGYTVVLRKE